MSAQHSRGAEPAHERRIAAAVGPALESAAPDTADWGRHLAQTPRSAAQRQRLQAAFGGAVQRKASFTGAGLKPDDGVAAVKPRARKALMALNGRVDESMFKAFQSALPQTSEDLSLGVQLIRMLHDPIEHGEFNLDNEQHVAMLFHEVMKVETRDMTGYRLSNALVEALGKHAQALGIRAPAEDPVIAGLGAFRGIWLQDALFEIKIKPPGVEVKDPSAGVDLDLANVEQLKVIHQHLGKKLVAMHQAAERPAKTPEGAPVWTTAYLGTGAAVAYHMVSNRLTAKPNDTIVIGKQQPWKPGSPEDRAFESVNHPMGWISPKRDSVDDEEQFADTEAFSKQIEAVIAAHSAMVVDATLGSGAITKDPVHPYHVIKTDRGTYRARHVVSALGIGKHKPPIKDEKTFKERQDSGQNARVLDMDEFHRQLRNEKSELNRVRGERKGAFSVVLVGPNAGVDVAFSTTTNGIETTWFAASGPAWVKGFANYGIDGSKLTVVLAYLGDYQPQFDDKVAVGVKAVAADDKFKPEMDKLLRGNGVKQVLNAAGAPKDTFDYLVHAAGPDTSASDALDPALSKALNEDAAVMPDKDHRFTRPLADPKDPKVPKGRTDVADDLTLDQGAPEKNIAAVLQRWYQPRGADAPRLAQEALKKVSSILGHLDAVRQMPFEAPLNARVEHADGSSIEVIGAQSARLPRNVPKPNETSKMAPSVDTLPPTVVGSDQLTSSRSRAEASANVVPAYLGKAEGGIDLATDDQVAIAAWVAMQHTLPPLLADYVTQRIIHERRGKADKDALGGFDPATGIRPDAKVPGSFGKTFTNDWTAKLKQLEQACSR